MDIRIGRARAFLLSAAMLGGSMVGTAAPAAGSLEAAGSVEQVYVTGLTPGADVSLLAPNGGVLETRPANFLGGALFREVEPAEGYRVSSEDELSAPLVVHDQTAAPWNPSIHQQSMPQSGYGYLTMRDGTKLAYTVHPPTSAGNGLAVVPYGTELPSGAPAYAPPYPTLIEYSGYAYADPSSDGPQSGIATLANAMGFAVVDISMRGMGCSGGAFDFFEPLQNLDGYDIVETVANQPWVRDHEVGMMGISYGGISQLFTAQLQPPSLAAITPLSVIDATATTLYPGGNLNTGFAVEWSKERQRSAQPAGQGLSGTQGYAEDRIRAGDAVCASNQALHPEAANLDQKIDENDHYIPSVADPLDPITFVDKINVPVFLACQWQDEQTGGHCPAMVSKFTGTDKKWFTFTNGAHIDSLSPETYNRWYDFLMLYVAKRPPMQNAAAVRAVAPIVFQATHYGLPSANVSMLPPDPIQLIPTYEAALEAFEALPMVRILFENGAGGSTSGALTPGDPYPAFERSYDTWPIAGTAAQTWYFGPDGTLNDALPDAEGADTYISDPAALPLTNYTGGTGTGSLWSNAPTWRWNWVPNAAGTAASYVSSPLPNDTTVVGGGAVYVWMRSNATDVDLQATISEVRPDGNETFVQNGYMRASERKLSDSPNNIFRTPSTLLNPVPSFLEADAAPLPQDGSYVQVAIPLYYQGHVYRAGSRIRVTIAGPNGAQPVWSFGESLGGPSTQLSILRSPSRPSKLVLPVVPGGAAPTELPACPSLRSQPCRPYVPYVNS
jgi:predicted acyl esterase